MEEILNTESFDELIRRILEENSTQESAPLQNDELPRNSDNTGRSDSQLNGGFGSGGAYIDLANRLRIDNRRLQQEVQNLALVADHLRSITFKSSREINRVLEKLKSELHSSSSRQDMSWSIPENTLHENQ